MWQWLSRNYKLLLGVSLALAALLNYSLGVQRQGQPGWFESLSLRLGQPLLTASSAFRYGTADLFGSILPGGQRALDEENRRLRGELAALTELRQENARLQQLLGFVEETSLPTLAARVIGEDASGWFRTIEIDRGSVDGIRDGLPVVNAAGLVGRVVRTTPHTARVLLITDASSAVAVLVQDQRIRGICRGQGGTLILDFALLQDDIQVGDGVITSGLGGVFPKGLVIGYVQAVQREQFGLFQTIEIDPAVDFAHLEEVLVLVGRGHE